MNSLCVQFAEVVGAARLVEMAREIGGDRLVVEQAVRQSARQARKRFEEAPHRRAPVGEKRALRSPGRLVSRRRNSPNAGRSSNPGSNGSLFDPSRMNISCISCGLMPLARPAAMKAPELTPTKTSRSVRQAPQRLPQRHQRADLVDAPERTAPREGDPHFAVPTPLAHWTAPANGSSGNSPTRHPRERVVAALLGFRFRRPRAAVLFLGRQLLGDFGRFRRCSFST